MFSHPIFSFVVLITALSVHAETITVGPEGKKFDYYVIQNAINAANNGDTISVWTGTYYEHSLNPNGKAITIAGTLDESGYQTTIIDGHNNGTVFTIENNENAQTVIKDLVIQNGKGDDAGGVWISEASPTFDNCVIQHNTTTDTYGRGGGVSINGMGLKGTWAVFTDCTFQSNTAKNGGAFYLYLTNLTLTNCTISDNKATSGNGGGINIEHDSTLYLNQTSIKSNSASSQGGGVYFVDSSATIDGVTICGNMPNQLARSDSSSYNGTGVNSIAQTCFADSGACCVTTLCAELTESQCISIAGQWLGASKPCSDCDTSGSPNCAGDFNHDHKVDVNDLNILIAAWGSCP